MTDQPLKPKGRKPRSKAQTNVFELPPHVRSISQMHDLLGSAIDRMDASVRIRESMAYALWAGVVGKAAAAATEVDTISNGVLMVRTRSSSWSHELTLHRIRIVERLNREIGYPVIKEIRFKAQGVSEPEAVVIEPKPTDHELLQIVFEPAEADELRTRLSELESIPDHDLRTRIADQLIASFRLRHWQIEHGWEVCPKCLTVYHEADSVCPFCRLM